MSRPTDEEVSKAMSTLGKLSAAKQMEDGRRSKETFREMANKRWNNKRDKPKVDNHLQS